MVIFASQETCLCETNNGLNFHNQRPLKHPFKKIFCLKYLLLFTKCANMCNQTIIYIKNDYPLSHYLTVANLGDIKLCLAPNVA